MEAHLLSLNDFNMPLIYDRDKAAYTNLVYLLLTDKGDFQSHPDLGVGLRTIWRSSNSDNLLSNLHNAISTQIEKFLPELEDVEISLRLTQDNILGIIIDTSTGTYVLAYDSNKDSIEADATYILNEL